MNIKEAKEIIDKYPLVNFADIERVIISSKAQGYIEAMKQVEETGIMEASKKIVDSISWSGDINQVNIAPKISELREAISKMEKLLEP